MAWSGWWQVAQVRWLLPSFWKKAVLWSIWPAAV
jgi:hypothetical protein